ncbi:MAG: sensor histidine kinase [Flammeovirgaceae bacterium]|nr:sensor histidine kinase [Flammeovirgaceae bacterium]
MKHLCVLIILFIIPITLKSQRDDEARVRRMIVLQRDSLKKVQTFPLPDSQRATVSAELSNTFLSFSDFDSVLYYAESSLEFAVKSRSDRHKMLALSTLGNAYGNFGLRDYKKALTYFNEARQIAEQTGDVKEIHKIYSGILNLYFYNSDFANAMRLTNEGLSLAEKIGDTTQIIHYNNLLGFIFLRQGNLSRAEEFYQLYLSLAKEVGDSVRIADALNNLGEVYSAQNLLQKSLEHHMNSWQLCKRLYLRKVQALNPDRMAFTLFKLANSTNKLGLLNEAKQYTTEGFNYLKIHPANEYDLAWYYLIAGDISRQLNELEMAKSYLHRGLSLSKKIKHQEDIRDAYDLLQQLHARLNRKDSAYFYLTLFTKQKDSIVNEKSKAQIQQIISEFDLAKKDQQIALLNEQQKLSESELSKQHFLRNALLISFALMGVIAYLLYSRYQLRQRNAFQKELNQKQNELFNAIVSVQDNERKRVAQDLHDGLGSILSTAKLKLSSLESERLSPEDELKYQTSLNLLDEAVQELRHVSHNIMPASLSRLGLPAALQNLLDKISSYSGLKIDFKAYGFEGRIDETTEMSLYRVVLELINNIVKHAHANQVTVQLIKHAQYINVMVEDDGCGFNYKEIISQNRGIGLSNIISRLEFLKGKMDVDSTEGLGTTIVIDIPIVGSS